MENIQFEIRHITILLAFSGTYDIAGLQSVKTSKRSFVIPFSIIFPENSHAVYFLHIDSGT